MRERDKMRSAEELAVDVLIITTTQDEFEQVREVATAFAWNVVKRRGYHFVTTEVESGRIGGNRVAIVKLESMGSFGIGGAAATCIRAAAETQATTLILVGIAYGVSPREQQYGDVLVSESVYFYDRREVDDAPGPTGYMTTFKPDARAYANEHWLGRLQTLSASLSRQANPIQINVGVLLSGGAIVNSARFRDELVNVVGAIDPPIVGGEMEAAGLVSTRDIGWIVIKGICDFGDRASRSSEEFEMRQRTAARNAALVLMTVLKEKE